MIQGPGIFLAQFLGEEAPFDSLDNICAWVASLGYQAVQIPSWDPRCMDLSKAAESKDYCDELQGTVARHGLVISELSTHLQGQLVAVHPAYDELFDGFAAPSVRGNPKARTEWAVQQVKDCLTACKHLGCRSMPSFTGALLWHTLYPWPQRPAGLVEAGFKELAARWLPILDHAEDVGVDVAWEVHPGEDVHDGATLEMFLDALEGHSRANILYDPSHLVLQGMDYAHYIQLYHERIKAFHVKDAEFRPDGRVGAYGGYQGWTDRAGRFRSLGDGQIDFARIFSLLTQYGYDSWAVLEWECCLKDPTQGATEGAPFIRKHLIKQAEKAFDDFAGGGADDNLNQRVLGLG